MRIDTQRVARVSLIFALAVTPAIFDPSTFKLFDAVKVFILTLGVWVAGIIVLATALLSKRASPRLRLYTPVALFLGAMVLSTVFSRTPVVSIFGWYSRWHGLVSLVLYALLALTVALLYARNPERLIELIYAVGFATVIVIVYIYIQWFDLDPLNWKRPTGTRVGFGFFGTLGNANFAGGFLGATVGWLLVVYRRQRITWRKLAVVAWAGIHVGATWLTQSRGGLFALITTVAAVGLLAVHRLPKWGKRALAVGALGAMALSLVVFFSYGSRAISPENRLQRSGQKVLRTSSLSVRMYWWQAAIGTFTESPVIGTGLDTYVVAHPKHLPPQASSSPDGTTADKPHNVYLAYLSETGLLGLATFGFLFGGAVLAALRRHRHLTEPLRTISLAAVAMLGGYAGQAFWSIDIIPLAMVGWFALGALAAIYDRGAEAARAAQPAVRRFSTRARAVRFGLTGVVALLGLAAILSSQAGWSAERSLKLGMDGSEGKASRATVVGYFTEVTNKRPLEPVYWGILGDYIQRQAAGETDSEKQRIIREAIDRFQEMDRLQPNFHVWKMSLAGAYGDLGSVQTSAYSTSDRLFREAMELAPYDYRVWERYANMLNAWGVNVAERDKHCQALELYQRTFDVAHWSQGSLTMKLAQTYAFLGQLDEAERFANQALLRDSNDTAAKDLLSRIESAGDIEPHTC